jgi:hypothetical protein
MEQIQNYEAVQSMIDVVTNTTELQRRRAQSINDSIDALCAKGREYQTCNPSLGENRKQRRERERVEKNANDRLQRQLARTMTEVLK